jgi:hypothetical protein
MNQLLVKTAKHQNHPCNCRVLTTAQDGIRARKYRKLIEDYPREVCGFKECK